MKFSFWKIITGIIIVLFVIIVVIIIIKSRQKPIFKDACKNDDDCPSNQDCVFSPDYNRKICVDRDKFQCKLDPVTSLTECDPQDEDNICKNCSNEPPFKCVVVDKDHPYKWKQGETIIEIPNSNTDKGWCLPPVSSESTCNTFTSTPVLIEKDKDKYQWGCECTLPNLFTQNSPGDNCNVELACGYPEDGQLHVVMDPAKNCQTDADCGDGNYCYLQNPDTGEKLCYTPWLKDQKSDPRDGICKCQGNKRYYGFNKFPYTKNCVSDSCQPNGTSTTQGCGKYANCCTCDNKYIRCPQDIPFDSPFQQECATTPLCLPDPCVTSVSPNGKWNPDTQLCECNAGETVVSQFDSESPTLQTCADLCIQNGPCKNRGTCYISGTAPNQKAQCKDCVCPWENPTPESGDSQVCQNNSGKGVKGDPCDYDGACCPNLKCKTHWYNPHGKCT